MRGVKIILEEKGAPLCGNRGNASNDWRQKRRVFAGL
jgi:hypothetical protein